MRIEPNMRPIPRPEMACLGASNASVPAALALRTGLRLVWLSNPKRGYPGGKRRSVYLLLLLLKTGTSEIFGHELRPFLHALLANPECADEDADLLANTLAAVNDLQRTKAQEQTATFLDV